MRGVQETVGTCGESPPWAKKGGASNLYLRKRAPVVSSVADDGTRGTHEQRFPPGIFKHI